MKKVIIGFIAGVLFATAGTAMAQTVIEKVTASIRTDYSVEVDGQKVVLSKAPLVYKGSSYLPIKEMSQIMGKDAEFDNGVIKIYAPTEIDELKYSKSVDTINIREVDAELRVLPTLIHTYKKSIEYGVYEGQEKIDVEKLIEKYEQRVKDLEARKAKLEAQEK